LGHFGLGWADIGTGFYEPDTCTSQSLLLRQEVMEWPSEPDHVRDLALQLGAMVEDAWGYRQRRFLTRLRLRPTSCTVGVLVKMGRRLRRENGRTNRRPAAHIPRCAVY